MEELWELHDPYQTGDGPALVASHDECLAAMQDLEEERAGWNHTDGPQWVCWIVRH